MRHAWYLAPRRPPRSELPHPQHGKRRSRAAVARSSRRGHRANPVASSTDRDSRPGDGTLQPVRHGQGRGSDSGPGSGGARVGRGTTDRPGAPGDAEGPRSGRRRTGGRSIPSPIPARRRSATGCRRRRDRRGRVLRSPVMCRQSTVLIAAVPLENPEPAAAVASDAVQPDSAPHHQPTPPTHQGSCAAATSDVAGNASSKSNSPPSSSSRCFPTASNPIGASFRPVRR